MSTVPFSADDVYSLIATGQIFTDWKAGVFVQTGAAELFADAETAASYARRPKHHTSGGNADHDLQPGTEVQWDDRRFVLVNLGSEQVWLRDGEGVTEPIRRPDFERFLAEGSIRLVGQSTASTLSAEAQAMLDGASPKDLEVAAARFRQVEAYRAGEPLGHPKRTVQNWDHLYREAEDRWGWGFLGLIPKKNPGNPGRRLDPAIEKIIDDVIDNDYAAVANPSKSAVYNRVAARCRKDSLRVPCFATVSSRIDSREQGPLVLRREGRKAHYQQKELMWAAEFGVRRHGDYPHHVCHIDHTLLDIMLVCERTGKALGRPWITMAIDAFTRRIMALSLSFNPPSYLSLCELVREYVRRWRRLASYFVHDGGREFRSTTFEVLMALYGSHLALRPPSEPRFGSIIERVLGILMQEVVLQLLGNTKLTKRDVRRVTREVDPRTTAVWTLAELASMLRAWAYEEYDQRDHPALLTSPRDWFERGLLHGGSRPMRLIAYDQLFQVMTMPFVSRGGVRQINPQRGVKVGEIQYWHDVFGRPALRGTKVRTRYDPWDARRVFSFAADGWREARNEQIEFLEDVTVRELEFASKGLDKLGKDHRSGRTSRAAQIGHFLAEQRDREGKLQDMRMKALAEADARAPLLLPGASLPSSHITVPAMPEEVPQALAAGTSPAPRVEPFLAGWDDDLGGNPG